MSSGDFARFLLSPYGPKSALLDVGWTLLGADSLTGAGAVVSLDGTGFLSEAALSGNDC